MIRFARALSRALCVLLLLGAAWLATALPAFAAGDLVAVPPLAARVTDVSGTLSSAQQAQLEQQLAAFEQARGSQIAILIVPTTQPEAIEQFSIRVAEAWKIGRHKQDDGVLITVAKNDRKIRIDVGYGLEGAIPDATAKRIISETISPRFKAGDFAGGLSDAVSQMQKLIAGESLPAPSANPAPPSGQGDFGGLETVLVVGLMLAVGLGGALRAMLGRLVGATLTGGVVGAMAWFITSSALVTGLAGVIAFIVVAVQSSGRGGGFGPGGGSWGGSSGGSWGSSGGSWGGSSGSSWSGGGGSFGGGGASGDW